VPTSPPPTRKREAHQLPLQKLFPAINTTFSPNSAEEKALTTALLNHSIHHGSDDELDRIVFSQLPEGSKLILRTIKIVKTDEDGNEEEQGQPAISLNVLPMNSTESDDEEDESSEEDEGSGSDSTADLETDASSHHKAGYDSYGTNEKEKDRTDSYYQGQDHAKKHKKTLTGSYRQFFISSSNEVGTM
jgi:hypothetical protein